MMLGERVRVVMDRPIGALHPSRGFIYPINYGFIPGLMAGDGEEQDAYILGPTDPLEEFEGVVVSIIHRIDDVEDKWVVAESPVWEHEIRAAVAFQEKYYQTRYESLLTESDGIVLCCLEPLSVLVICNKGDQHWGLPKGHREPGETSQQAALREVCEEVGIQTAFTHDFHTSIRYNPGGVAQKSKTVHFFLSVLLRQITPVIQQSELSAALWLPPKEALARITYNDEQTVVKKALQYLGV